MTLAFLSLPACGSGGGSSVTGSESGTTSSSTTVNTSSGSSSSGSVNTTSSSHTLGPAPEWLLGEWDVVRIQDLGVEWAVDFNVTFTEYGFEYSYGDMCNGAAELEVEQGQPSFATSDYKMTIVWADCHPDWGFLAEPGVVDEGYFWENDGWIYHYSRLSTLYWVYRSPDLN